ncbi:related to Mig1-Mig1 protein, induced during biotrophic phase [Sporisorium scitamineum]|uniref:Related to Mig1-Mig1 protein, induced during biotrophic phase n=1 Tax=Sporisorium scitamineum TaxID=49012 RepID=A0A0F7SAB5_9BASI|nr:related to Mig1-Mig1 protein, induced during biotrophic phase [Sporisorium scitamineum]CDW97735.1 hypothetical protein [Sporisorium scitamineum]
MYSSLALFLKLVAAVLVVSIHRASSAMTRVPLGLQTLARRSEVRKAPSQAQCWPTTLSPNNPEYEKRCGEKSDAKHPCMTHWWNDLKSIQARPWLEPHDIQKMLFVKDDKMLDFTMSDPKESFIITYLAGGNAQLIYSDYEETTGCYKITLRGNEKGDWRIWVSDDEGSDRDIDTQHYPETSKKLCTKWAHIHAKHDGGSGY